MAELSLIPKTRGERKSRRRVELTWFGRKPTQRTEYFPKLEVFLSDLFIRRLAEETAPLPVPPVRQVAQPNKHADTETVTHNFDNYGRNLIRVFKVLTQLVTFKAILFKMPRAARRSAAGNVFFSSFSFFACCSVFLGECLCPVRRSRTLLTRN